MRVGRDAAPPGVATQPRPGAALGAKPGGRTTRTPCGPRPVEGKLPRMPRGAPVGAIGESQMAPRMAPIGAPSPSIRGEGKKKRIRANPRARIKTGAALLWLFDN